MLSILCMNKPINQKRVKVLQEGDAAADGPVIYLMAREQRVFDNWALLHAAAEADRLQVPLMVVFVIGPMFCSGSRRHNDWMIASLQVVEQQLKELQLPFLVDSGDWGAVVPRIVRDYNCQKLVFDFNPLEPVATWREAVVARTSVAVEVVDARNIVPVWIASDKAEFAAYTFRPKVTRLLAEFLVPCPVLRAPSQTSAQAVLQPNWEVLAAYRSVAVEAPLPEGVVPGAAAASIALKRFVSTKLATYATDRNDPIKDATSGLSAYLRWGNIAASTVALAVQKADVDAEHKEAFLEELIVRRELCDNYVFYTKDYATVAAAHPWAQKTLAEHVHDVREYTYTLDEFAAARTHDDLWNAAQLQMVTEGKMHGYMRMYWAKKILEWTNDPQTAIDIALQLNDTYQLDGRDSNGVVGVMWSVAGVHDRAWGERPVFGKIRYMNSNGCKRKFDVATYIHTYIAPQPSLIND